MIGEYGETGADGDRLGDSFMLRLESSLGAADAERRRRLVRRRAQRAALAFMLLLPIVSWRLMLATPDGVHVAVGALAEVAFTLQIGVHLDTSVLSYLSLQALPTIVGVLLLAVVTAGVLVTPRKR
jgi:hypothetical protein